MPVKCCANCSILTKDNVCRLFKTQIQYPYGERCPNFTKELVECENCGNSVVLPQILTENEQTLLLCDNCVKLSGTCNLCTERTQCDFETNPLSLPKVIIKQIRQGNQMLQVQIKNPERIRETCEKNCKCFDKEFGCGKENGCCGNYITDFNKGE